MTTAITPYVSRAVARSFITPPRWYPTRQRVRAANIIRNFYYASRLGKGIKMRAAARKIQGLWRAKAARRSAPQSKTNTRQKGAIQSDVTISMRTLLAEQFQWPTQGADIGQRLGATIRLSGIKLCEQITNDLAYPVVVHYAIVQEKTEKTPFRSDFFRDTTSGSDRSKDFENASPGSASQPYDFSYDCFPMNPDRFYILMHYKKVLAAENPDTQWRWDTWKFEKYLNFKGKKFTFDTSADVQPQKPLYKVIWWQPLRQQDWATPIPAQLPILKRQTTSIMYFRPNFI